MARLTGRATVVLNGQILKSEAGASIQTGGIVREPVVSDQGTVDYRETVVHCEVKGNFIHDAATSLDGIRGTVGVPVNFETDSGVTYTVGDAFCMNIGDLSGGRFEATFGGKPAIEQLP